MVDGLEQALAERVRIVRLNVDDEAGQQARARFQTEKVPAIILLDGDGVQRYRTEGKLPRRQAILAALGGE